MTPVIAGPTATSRRSGLLQILAELGWLMVFVLAIPLVVLAIGVPVALAVRLVLSLFHLG